MRGDTLTIGFLKNAEPNATARAGFITSKRLGERRRPQPYPPAFARDFSQASTRNSRRNLDRDHRLGTSCAGTFRALEDEWLRPGAARLLFFSPDAAPSFAFSFAATKSRSLPSFHYSGRECGLPIFPDDARNIVCRLSNSTAFCGGVISD